MAKKGGRRRRRRKRSLWGRGSQGEKEVELPKELAGGDGPLEKRPPPPKLEWGEGGATERRRHCLIKSNLAPSSAGTAYSKPLLQYFSAPLFLLFPPSPSVRDIAGERGLESFLLPSLPFLFFLVGVRIPVLYTAKRCRGKLRP